MTTAARADTTTDWVASARALAPLLEREATATEDTRTASDAAVQALREAGMFSLILPREFGGAEIDLATFTDVLAALAYADGSLGWTVLANATNSGFAAVYTGDAAAREMFGSGRAEAAGQLSPRGSIIAAPAGGWTLSGKFGFGSGSAHAAWIGGGALELVNGKPVIGPGGMPHMRACFVPREAVVFQDGWDVMGLRGTGSYDFDITEQHVPEDFTFELMGPARRGPAMFRLRVGVIGTVGHAGWALGAGRRALDEALAAAERPFMRGMTPVGQLEGYLTELGRVDASLRAARSFALDVFGEAEAFIEHADAPSAELSARVQEAITFCTRAAVDAVRTSFEWAGVSAIRNGPLERVFRDVHVAAQHVTQTRASFANVTALAIA